MKHYDGQQKSVALPYFSFGSGLKEDQYVEIGRWERIVTVVRHLR